MNYLNDFACFILTHGRANNVITYKKLRGTGYTGKIYIIIDNEDSQADEYIANYGDEVVIFDKLEVSKNIDTCDNFGKRNTIVFARNVCFDIAEKLGLKWFCELDDDYTNFSFRHIVDDKLIGTNVKNMDNIFNAMIDFLETTQATTIAMAQGGDFIGGAKGGAFEKKFLRKAMNSFVCRVDRRFKFAGYLNEDVNVYTSLGSRGVLFFTTVDVSLNQKQTQSQKGGITDAYLDGGTYVKSFYSVINSPSCVKVEENSSFKRYHHVISWNNCTPKIIDAKYKKGEKSL